MKYMYRTTGKLTIAGALSLLSAALLLTASTAAARDTSLYDGPGPKPGPPILYAAAPKTVPQLQNTGIWHAAPILISGTQAYRQGEYLYQGFLYDDYGAREVPDPNDPQLAEVGDLFSMPDGTYTYPTGAGYDGNATNLVEFRAKPLANATAFRITLNTLKNQDLIAFSIAIGGTPGQTHPFPDGANVVAPAKLFLTVRPLDGRLQGQLVRAGSDKAITAAPIQVRVDTYRRQIQLEVPHSDWNPGRQIVRLALGLGLWDASTGSYLLPGVTASATKPGGGGLAPDPAAFFDVGFRFHEPLPSVDSGTAAILAPAWWRDLDQATALTAHNISSLYAEVNFAALDAHVTDNSMVPHTGFMDRILASHYSLGQGESFAHTCGLTGSPDSGGCSAEYLGQLQPYAIYVPNVRTPKNGFGLTVLLHSLSANYNQFAGSRNESQFANRPNPAIVLTSEARGPDQDYEGLGGADVFEAWAALSRLYRLNPAYTDLAGYSMGGDGTFTLAEEFPDLFARAQPTVGDSSNNEMVASLRNVPVLMWNNIADELVDPALYLPTVNAFDNDGYRFQTDIYRPCASTLCSPAFPDHLELAVNDEYAPAASFLGSAEINYDPFHITYVVPTSLDVPKYNFTATHAYWLADLTTRTVGKTNAGEINTISLGFGKGDPTPSALRNGLGALTGGYMGPIQYVSLAKTWGPTPTEPKLDEIEITATNIATAAIDVLRADVNCQVQLKVTTDGPLTITLPGCNRVMHYS
jgi:hypothetical protein